VADTLAILDHAGLSPSTLVLDVAEDAVTSADPLRRAALVGLADAGVGVAVDDFGRGSLGVASLHRLPASQLKLDRSLVADIDRDPRARSTARTLISLAADLGLLVVAEGVERPAQRDTLRDVGCSFAQGFALGLPAWADDLAPELCATGS
jgi:EAL domain-containing protein (putative c-di-GMP-specific phosphodiesterase class I)